MAEPAERAVLPPEATARLTDFARSCKAAARAVSLYPAGHPTIVATLSRVADATARLTESGPFAIQVHAHGLLVEQGHLPKPDAAVAELASLLHRHLIGHITLNVGADAHSWRTLLLLLARSPEEVRADGGISRLWETAGGPSIEIREVDYAEVLREKQGREATIENLIAAAMSGAQIDHDDPTMRALLETVNDSETLKELLHRLESTAAGTPQGVQLQTTAFLSLVRNLVGYASRTGPQLLGAVFGKLAEAARHLSVDAMIGLLGERGRPEAMAGNVNMVSAILDNMTDASVAGFIAASVVAERGASERLAHAFRALVPLQDRQRQLLGLAKDELAQTELASDERSFSELWQRVERIMTSYTDARYVSTDYARELSQARTQPMDVEQTSDDPPERVSAWLSTVSDSALRNLDHDLLIDLLTIETDPLRWRDLTETVVTHADDLVRVGYFDQSLLLMQKVIEAGARDPQRQPHSVLALERFGRGSLMKHLPVFLRTAEPESVERVTQLCHTIGPIVIAPLAERLAAEQDARSRRRLRDILVGFGPKGAESVRPLMHSENWEVRRTAALLLREYGGSEGLKELVPLLADAEPLVQREAVQSLVMNGSREASAILLKAILSSKGRTRETLMNAVLAMRDERAAPLFGYVLRQLDPRTLPALYDTAVDVLGGVATDDAVDALKGALHKGQWWTPFANRRRRPAAAHSLRRIGTVAALAVLRDAVQRGSPGVRKAARTELED
jgi:hypothetical protein